MKKLLAFHLPQFHSIPENDKWWGEGFTEWVNTKKAKPLYKGHEQPKVPFEENYYNLLDESTLKWQANLAKEYGIHGFCFYHYWFNGKKLLEKPLEKILDLKDIDTNYCFSWANEPWTRAWDGKNREVLMPQEYGGEEEWKEHFYYLLKFFQDRRYIKKDGKPVFLIYRTNNIPNCEEMVEYWNKLARENGFKGIYVIETMNSFQKKPFLNSSEAVVEFEPMYTMRHGLPLYVQATRYIKKKLGILDRINFDVVWNRILRRQKNYGKKKYLGAFVNWDNTARKGKKGLVIAGGTPLKFKKNLKNQIEKSKQEFIFINAWNEWAEGTYLEPDTKNGYQYLEIIREVMKIHE